MDEAGGVYPSNEYGRYCVPKGLEDRPAARAVIARWVEGWPQEQVGG